MFNLIIKCERWKFNKDYGVWVSTEGHFKDRYKRVIPYKIMRNGYCVIKTERDPILAHRLVMITWRPCEGYEHLTVDHLNHNKRDNSLNNLEWVTADENQTRAIADEVKAEDFKCHRAACQKITELEAKVKKLENKVKNVQNKEIDALRGQLKELRKENNKLEQSMAGLRSYNKKLKAEIEALKLHKEENV